MENNKELKFQLGCVDFNNIIEKVIFGKLQNLVLVCYIFVLFCYFVMWRVFRKNRNYC